MPVVPFVKDDRPFFNFVPALIISTNVTTFFFILVGAVIVMVTKGFRFQEKRTRIDEYIKQRQMTFRLGKDPNSVPKPLFSDQKEMEKEDKKIIYNRLRDPSQFVFEGFGFKRPLTIVLYIFRVIVALWITVMMSVDPSYFRPKDFMTYFSFFTNASALVLAIYYVLQSVFGLFYITSCYKYFNESETAGPTKSIEELNPWVRKLFNLVSTVLWLLAEWNHVSAVVVVLGYWVMVIPDLVNGTPTNNDPDPMSYFTFGYHGTNLLVNIIEFFMSNLVFRIWHIFLVLLYPAIYCIWVQVILETGAATKWPYGIIDYYRYPWYSLIFFVFGLFLVFIIVFVIYWFVTTLRLMILTKKLKNIRGFLRRKATEKVGGMVADSVHTFVNTVLDMDHMMMDVPHHSVHYKANSSISTALSTTPPISPMSNCPATDENVVSPIGLIHTTAIHHHPTNVHTTIHTTNIHHTTTTTTSNNNTATTTTSINKNEIILDIDNHGVFSNDGKHYEEPLAPRGHRRTHDVVNKLIKIKNNNTTHNASLGNEVSIIISPISPSDSTSVLIGEKQ